VKRLFLAWVFFYLLVSCAHVPRVEGTPEFLRDGFVKIAMSVVDDSLCKGEDDNECQPSVKRGAASGFIIHGTDKGSYVLSAEHVCVGKNSKSAPGSKISVVIIGASGKGYRARILWTDFFSDICVLWVPSMTEGSEVRVSPRPPAFGDHVMNLASPRGIAKLPYTLPVFEGKYCGSDKRFAMYTIPTARGSSGSPIFNDEGYLVGMIQARLVNFSNIALSALYNDIVKVVKMVKSGKLKAEK